MTGRRTPSGLLRDERAIGPSVVGGVPVLAAAVPVLAVFGPPVVGAAAVAARPTHTRRYAVAVVAASVCWMVAVVVLQTGVQLAVGAVPALAVPLAHLYAARRDDRVERALLAGIYYSPLVVGGVLASVLLI